MPPASLRTAADAASFVRAGEHDHVKVAVTDIDGVLRGKYMHRDKFLAALDDGFGLCDVVLGWGIADDLYSEGRGRVTGWHTGFPDAPVAIAPETGRPIPFEDGLPLFLAEFAGDAAAVCPRGVLQRVLARADAMGFGVTAGFEYEFFVFAESPQSVRAKRYHRLEPLAPDNTGYSLLRATAGAEFYHDLLATCGAMAIPLEGLHEEMGAGALEAAIEASDGLEAADRAVLFKTVAKAVAQRRGLMATFMARWSAEEAGQSGHIHLSLARKRGARPAFHDATADDGMSATMRAFLAGQQALMPEFAALFAPTVNSWRRLQPGAWAPTTASWGHDNRTVALRVISGSAKACRIEYRAAGADANPYLALAAALASGLAGIERGLEPTAPVTGNAYAAKLPKRLALPGSLDAAAARLRRSTAARAWFGDRFVDHFADSRDWEAQQFARAVTDWELARYFELI